MGEVTLSQTARLQFTEAALLPGFLQMDAGLPDHPGTRNQAPALALDTRPPCFAGVISCAGGLDKGLL